MKGPSYCCTVELFYLRLLHSGSYERGELFDRGQVCQGIVYMGLVIRGSFIVGSLEKGLSESGHLNKGHL